MNLDLNGLTARHLEYKRSVLEYPGKYRLYITKEAPFESIRKRYHDHPV